MPNNPAGNIRVRKGPGRRPPVTPGPILPLDPRVPTIRLQLERVRATARASTGRRGPSQTPSGMPRPAAPAPGTTPGAAPRRFQVAPATIVSPADRARAVENLGQASSVRQFRADVRNLQRQIRTLEAQQAGLVPGSDAAGRMNDRLRELRRDLRDAERNRDNSQRLLNQNIANNVTGLDRPSTRGGAPQTPAPAPPSPTPAPAPAQDYESPPLILDGQSTIIMTSARTRRRLNNYLSRPEFANDIDQMFRSFLNINIPARAPLNEWQTTTLAAITQVVMYSGKFDQAQILRYSDGYERAFGRRPGAPLPTSPPTAGGRRNMRTVRI